MVLMKPGCWHDTAWADRSWFEDLWLEYGTGVPPPPPLQDVSIWLEPKRKRRLPLDREVLEAVKKYLEVKQNV